jgi:hypothetical protein
MKNPVTIILSVAVVVVSAGAALLYSQTQKLQSANNQLDTQLAEANSQFTSATSQLAEVNSQLDAANQEIAQMRPDVQRARTMPITIRRRKALTNNGYVYTFWNSSRKPLALHVTITNPAFSQSKEFHLVVDGGLFKDIGWYQGWPGAPGDTIKVECAGYDPLVKTSQ